MTFITGGPVRFDSPFYIQRSIEKHAFDSLVANKYVTLIGPRQFGKTSLLQRIQAIFEQEYNYAAAWIDLSTFNYQSNDPGIWLSEFCTHLQGQLKVFAPDDFRSPVPNKFQDFITYLDNLATQISCNTILILLDEANAVPRPIRDVFYSNIRWIFTDRTAYRTPFPNLRKFNFAFAGVFAPERLTESKDKSPFNVSEVIYMEDFTIDEVMSLLSHINEKWPNTITPELAETIYSWTEGHPYLSQRLANDLLITKSEHPDIVFNVETIEQIALQLLNLDNTEHVIKSVLHDTDLINLMQFIISNKVLVFSRSNENISKLFLIGAIRETPEGFCAIRNEVYKLAFQRALAAGPKFLDEGVKQTEKTDLNHVSPHQLLNILDTSFDEEELKDLCFELRCNHEELQKLDYEALPSTSKRGKARELILFVQRLHQYQTLVNNCYKKRPSHFE